MAKIGLQNFLCGELTEQEDGTATYGIAHKPGNAIDCDVSINNNDAELRADDAVAESDTSFQKGTIKMGIDDEDDAMMAFILGHQYEDGTLVRRATDIAPYLGVGRVITKIVNGVYKYKVEFLHKVKMGEPSQSEKTRGESVEFNTSEINGTVSVLKDGRWSTSKTFNTISQARNYLQSFFNATTSATITYNVNGGTGSIDSVSTYVGAIINVNDGEGITPPAGKTFAGWDTSSTATTADIIETYKVNGNVTLYAIYEDE